MKVSLVREMRRIDQAAAERYGLPELLLMENAGHRAAEQMAALMHGVKGKTICILRPIILIRCMSVH